MEKSTPFSLLISFQTIEELSTFVSTYSAYTAWLQRKSMKNENDKRGKHVGILHEKAREYMETHTDLTYRECFKLVSQEYKKT